MDLTLSHGRDHPDEQMDEIGFDGPTLHGVHSVQQRYRITTTVKFVSEDAAKTARLLTRWPIWDDCILEVSWHGDLIETHESDGQHRYYADIVLYHPSIEEEIRKIEECLSEARYNLKCATRDLDRKANDL